MLVRRLVAGTAVIVTASLAAAPTVPIAANTVVAAEKSMADRSNPYLSGIPDVMEAEGERAYLQWEGLAEGAAISSVLIADDYGVSTFGYSNALRLEMENALSPYLELRNFAQSEDGTVRGTFNFVINYGDGSIGKTTQQFAVRTKLQKDAYQPRFADKYFPEKQETDREFIGVPEGTVLTLLGTSSGWEAAMLSDTEIRVKPDEPYKSGVLAMSVRYPDGSTELHNAQVSSTKAGYRPVAPEKTLTPETVTETLAPETIIRSIAVTTTKTVTKSETTTATVTRPAVPATSTMANNPETVTVTKPVTHSAVGPTVTVTPSGVENKGAEPTATVTRTVTKQNDRPDGSSTGSIVALLIGLLSLVGGIGFAMTANPELRAILPR